MLRRGHRRAGRVARATEIAIALDAASSEFYRDGAYQLAGEGRALPPASLSAYLAIWSPLPDRVRSRTAWPKTTGTAGSCSPRRSGDRIQLVGDDLFVTNVERLGRGIAAGVANSILVKVNQIGTLSETLDTVALATRAAYTAVMSHRSGETEDTTIADLAVATGCGQIKTGAPARSDRVAKYNQLLRIEEILGDTATFPGASALAPIRKPAPAP